VVTETTEDILRRRSDHNRSRNGRRDHAEKSSGRIMPLMMSIRFKSSIIPASEGEVYVES